jgi:predicted transcriptional regulator
VEFAEKFNELMKSAGYTAYSLSPKKRIPYFILLRICAGANVYNINLAWRYLKTGKK